MIYNEFQGKKLSALGLGCMRFPVIGGNDAQIDAKKAEEIIDLAMKSGINYYDTAWGYHGGNSEKVLGEILSKYPRDSFYLASKFPGYDLANIDKVEEIFEKQLEKCRVDYFDFYLFHNVCEMNINEYLDDQYRIYDYLIEQKKNGRIRHLGFSAHGSINVIKRFLEAYGGDMEFCQLQINYLDWTFQSAKEKVELVSSYNIPIWVMEPVRGGKLAALADEYEAELKALRPRETTAAWAFRFVQSIPEVKVTLSGMSNMEQLTDNIKTYSQGSPLSDDEKQVLSKIAEDMLKKSVLPCTACKYCVSHCPQELNIPELLELYNEHKFTENGFIAPMALAAIADDKKPSACIGCRSCESVCPQGIKISEALADFDKKIRG